jgi:fermentation-respiration switch protein FrsA (DUF1100 family)
MLPTALVFVAAIAGALGLVWFVQPRLLYPHPPPPDRDLAAAVPGLEKVWLGPNRSTEAWLLVPSGANGPVPALIFGHGNGELIDSWTGEFLDFPSWGLAVMLVEYPGYGRSGGRPSEESITEAFVAAYDDLASRPEIASDSIVGYGRSLGGGAVCAMAARRDVAGLILESTFTSVADVARGIGVPRFLIRDVFDNKEVLSGYDGRVLLIHGKRDQVIPYRHAETLQETARDSRLLTKDCGHNDCGRPWTEVRAFMRELGRE